MKNIPLLSVIKDISTKLTTYGFNEYDAISHTWWLIEKLFDRSKLELLVSKEVIVTPEQVVTLASWVTDITDNHKPIAYVLGTIPFAGTSLEIYPPLLIPRIETEEWVLTLIEKLTPYKDLSLKILDMCTGSGCIGISLAKKFPAFHITAVDISPLACTLTQKNSLRNGIQNITVLQSNLFEKLLPCHQFDLILSNPPYISFDEYKTVEKSVFLWEDPQALVCEDNGMSMLKMIIEQSHLYINKKHASQSFPTIMLEIGYQQGPATKKMLYDHGYEAHIWQDIYGKDRIAWGSLNAQRIADTDVSL
jgi:release factor glutamine methyltransferase